MTNTVAYHCTETITAVKRLITLSASRLSFTRSLFRTNWVGLSARIDHINLYLEVSYIIKDLLT